MVLDTDVLVSGLAYPGSVPGRIVAAWRQGALDVVLSRYLLDELACVLPRLNHRLKWRPADFADLIDILAIEADMVEPATVPGSEVHVTLERFTSVCCGCTPTPSRNSTSNWYVAPGSSGPGTSQR